MLGPSIYSQMVWEQRQRRARELFPKGPTPLDLPRLDLRESGAGVRPNMSHRSCVT